MATLDQADYKLMSRAFKDALDDALGGSSRGFGNKSQNNHNNDDGGSSKLYRAAQTRSLKSLNEYTKETNRLAAAYAEAEATTKQHLRAERTYANHLKESSGYLASLLDASKMIDRTYRDSAAGQKTNTAAQRIAIKRLVESSDSLSSKFVQSQRQASLLSATMLGSSESLTEGTQEYSLYVGKLSKSIEGLGQQFLEQEDLWDNLAKGVKDNLKPEDFKRLRVRLGEAGVTLTKNFENFGDLGIKNIHDLAEKGGKAGNSGPEQSAIAAAMNSTIKELLAAGHNIKGFDSQGQTGAKLDALINAFVATSGTASQALSDFAKTTDRSINQIDAAATKAVSKFGQMAYKIEAAFADPLMALAKHVGSDAVIAKGLSQAKAGAVAVYKDLVDFNIAAVPASFGQVTVEATKMGLSFKAGTEFLQANQHTLSLYGYSAFDDLRGQLGATFTKFGYNLEQSSKIIGPAIAEAASSGSVDIQDHNALNNSINESMTAFDKIKGAVGGTAEEYFKLNASLNTQEGVSTTLLGLNKQQAAAYTLSLKTSRDEIAARTGSLELAQRLTQEQESVKREALAPRLDDAAKTSIMMNQLGYSAEDSARAQQTIMAGVAASKEDSAWLKNLAPQLQTRAAQYSSQYVGTGNIGGQIMTEQVMDAFGPKGAMGKWLSSNEQLAIQAKGNGLGNNQQIAGSAAAAKGSATGASIGTGINFLSAVKDNPFISAITGAGLALGGLAVQSLLTAASLGKLGGGMGSLTGFLGKLFGGGGAATAAKAAMAVEGGALSLGGMAAGGASLLGLTGAGAAIKGGGIGSLAGSFAKSSGGMGIIGMATGMAGDYAASKGYNNVGAGMNIAGDALNGAAMGALLGPIGMAAGGLIGAAYGVYAHSGQFGSPSGSASPTPNPGGGTVQPDGTVTPDNVNNQSAQAQTAASTSGIQNVVDTQSLQQLLLIAENTAKSAQILQALLDGGGVKTAALATSAARATAYSYQTGRR